MTTVVDPLSRFNTLLLKQKTPVRTLSRLAWMVAHCECINYLRWVPEVGLETHDYPILKIAVTENSRIDVHMAIEAIKPLAAYHKILQDEFFRGDMIRYQSMLTEVSELLGDMLRMQFSEEVNPTGQLATASMRFGEIYGAWNYSIVSLVNLLHYILYDNKVLIYVDTTPSELEESPAILGENSFLINDMHIVNHSYSVVVEIDESDMSDELAAVLEHLKQHPLYQLNSKNHRVEIKIINTNSYSISEMYIGESNVQSPILTRM